MHTDNSIAKSFASDNYSGVHPKVIESVIEVNNMHAASYGKDECTSKLNTVFSDLFKSKVSVYPVLTGTGANVVALRSILKPWQSVISSNLSHINVDEGGAPEVVAGIKILPITHVNGKISVESINEQAWGWGDQHRAQPGLVSITQSTELGTVYSESELYDITNHCKRLGLFVHLDGARLPNALVENNHDFSFYSDIGVDVISLGGTKCGAMNSESLIVLNKSFEDAVLYLRKSHAQLYSKMRYVSAQTLALYESDLWRTLASNANKMAKYLRDSLVDTKIVFPFPTESNAVFAILPKYSIEKLSNKWSFYTWDENTSLVRWMTSWDTDFADVDLFVKDIKDSLL